MLKEKAALAGAAEVGTQNGAESYLSTPSEIQHREALKPDTNEAVRFLQYWCPEPRPVTLFAYWLNVETGESEDLPGKTTNFEMAQFAHPVAWDKVADWIAIRQNAARSGAMPNIYYAVNPLRAGAKANGRENVASLAALHVDVDCRPGEEQQAGVARIINVFEHCQTPPTDIIASGGGAWALWRLSEAVPVDGDVAKANHLAGYNKQIACDLAGDSAHDISRIARCPGTINIPNDKKLKKGRLPSLARWHSHIDATYPLDAFKMVAPYVSEEQGFRAADNYERVARDDARLAKLEPRWLDLGQHGDVDGKYNLGHRRSGALFAFCIACVRVEVPDQVIAALITDPDWKISAPILEKQGPARKREVERSIERARKYADEDLSKPAVLGKATWRKTYDQFCLRGAEHLIFHNGDYLNYAPTAGCYQDVEKKAVNGMARRFLDNSLVFVEVDDKTGEKIFAPFNPCNKSVDELVGAVDCYALHDVSLPMPRWLDDRDGPDPNNLISFPNGILDLGTGALMPPDPMLLTTNAVGFDYDPSAGDPKGWKRFLAQVYGGEQSQIEALQELYGYSLSSDVSLEKAFMLLGPKRSGKDTQKNMLCTLLSPNAVCGPTLDLMGTPFGMSALVNKQMAIVGDMRLGHKADKDALAENVLKLTGRGLFTFDRKYKGHWTGRLPCKLLLISNEMPKIKDISGALASRFIIFNTRVSFYEKEDPNLFRDKLAPEAPGVLLWALEGLRRVRERGSLAEPESSKQERLQLARDGSPVLAFFEECLSLDPEGGITLAEMHEVYLDWSAAFGLRPLAKNAFVHDLIAATGGKVRSYRKADDARTTALSGARVKEPRPPKRPKRGGDDEVPF